MTAWFTGHRVLRACPSVASVRTPSSVRLDGAMLCGQTTFCLSTICCWGLGWSPPISVVNQPGLTPHGVHTASLPAGHPTSLLPSSHQVSKVFSLGSHSSTAGRLRGTHHVLYVHGEAVHTAVTLGSACTTVRAPALRVSPTAPCREDGNLEETQGQRVARKPWLRSSGLPVGACDRQGRAGPCSAF